MFWPNPGETPENTDTLIILAIWGIRQGKRYCWWEDIQQMLNYIDLHHLQYTIRRLQDCGYIDSGPDGYTLYPAGFEVVKQALKNLPPPPAPPKFRHNPDEPLRAAERRARETEDPEEIARWLQLKLRAGLLTPGHLDIAADLGYWPAQMLLGRDPGETVDWTNSLDRNILIYQPMLSLNPRLTILAALDLAEQLLEAIDRTLVSPQFFELPRKALEVARKYVSWFRPNQTLKEMQRNVGPEKLLALRQFGFRCFNQATFHHQHGSIFAPIDLQLGHAVKLFAESPEHVAGDAAGIVPRIEDFPSREDWLVALRGQKQYLAKMLLEIDF